MFTFVLGGKTINIYNAPVLNETKDGTGESGEFVLEFQAVKEPIAPYTEFSIYQNGSLITNAIVESDEVEIVSKSPITYKHTINFKAKVLALENYFVRDSVITQPPIRKASCYFSKFSLTSGPQSNTTQYRVGETSSETFTLPKHAKIKNAYFNVKVFQINTAERGYTLSDYTGELPYCTIVMTKSDSATKYNLITNQNIKYGDTISVSTDFFTGGGTFTISDLILNSNLYSESLELLIVSCELIVEYYYYNLYNVIEELKTQMELKEEIW